MSLLTLTTSEFISRYIDIVMDDSSCAWKCQLLLSREACVFLKWSWHRNHWIWSNVKKVKQPGIGTREPINRQSGVRTQEPVKQEQCQKQANTEKSSRSNLVWKQLRQNSEKSGCRFSRRCSSWISCYTVELEILLWTTITVTSITQRWWRFQCITPWQSIQRERQTTENFQTKGRWWTEDSRCCRTQQKAQGPSEAQRNTMIEEKPIMRSAWSTPRKLHTQRKTKADDMMSMASTRNARRVRGERRSTARTARPASPHAACEGPCKQREVNRSSAERGTTMEELQEYVTKKIPEVTRNQTANDGKHRDGCMMTNILTNCRRREEAVSVRDEAENYRDEDETNKSNTEIVSLGSPKQI